MNAFPPSSVLAAALLISAVSAQTPVESSPEWTAVVANDRAYEAAFKKGDAKALVEFFTEDAEYTADDGRTYSGRAEIGEAIRAGLLANKGAELSITATSVKVLAANVVSEKGVTTVAGKDGSSTGAAFTAIHLKKDDKWKIGQLTETPLPEATSGERLAELSWLIGEWEETDKGNDLEIRSHYLWARGGNFITRNLTVKQSGITTLEGWQVIGWDPSAERIRSWTFDNEGGYSEGVWAREGNRWLLRESGFTGDGSRISADNTVTKVGSDRFTWESDNRTLNGDPQPNVGRIEINRVKGR